MLKILKCVCSDRDNAGVLGPSFRRREDQNLPGCPLAAVVRLHKDISMTPFCNILCSETESLLALLTGVLCFCHQTDLYSGALFIQVCLGWNLYLSTVLMLVVTALYTIAGTQTSTHTCIITSGITNFIFFRCSGMLLADIKDSYHSHALPFRWSCRCHLHRHPADICHDSWSYHLNNHWFVQLSY